VVKRECPKRKVVYVTDSEEEEEKKVPRKEHALILTGEIARCCDGIGRAAATADSRGEFNLSNALRSPQVPVTDE
jgi:hypothetical protein